MDLKRRIGELFVIGFHGTQPEPEVLDFAAEWGIGGLIFFARNLADPKQIRTCIEAWTQATGCQPFTAIDQEGGLVLRLLNCGSPFPGAMALAATDRPGRTMPSSWQWAWAWRCEPSA